MTVNETCSCGATFQARGYGARAAVATWRAMHPCKLRDTPWPWPSNLCGPDHEGPSDPRCQFHTPERGATVDLADVVED